MIEVASGKVLAANNARDGFIPASVAKMPAAMVILHRLGGDKRFTTTLATTGSLDKKGTLNGDLILVGGGDPSLLHDDLQQMAKDLAKAGVKRVNGAFYYDETAIPVLPSIEPRQPDDVPYNPPLGGLAVDFSRFLVRWPQAKDGSFKAPVGSTVPVSPASVVDLPASPAPSGEKWLPVKEAGPFAAQVFAAYAQQERIALPAPRPAPAGTTAKTVLVSHASEPLSVILKEALYSSNNMALETLALAATASKTPAEAGTKINESVQAMLPNVAWSKFTFILPNASGLTDQAQMTPGQCAALAAHAATTSLGGVPFKPLLRGRKLDPFMADDPGALPVLRTKTGTIFYARALAGILTPASGKEIAFCLMTDDPEQRKVYDALPFDQRDVPQNRDPAKDWTKAAREQEEQLVKSWFAKY